MHDNLGHRGLFATCSVLLEKFWWPQVSTDIVWYICTCHLCQVHQTTKVLIPPTVTMPALLFSKIYIDTMFMPPSNKFKYIIQGHCLLTHYSECHMLAREHICAWQHF
ncbi:Pro-Pol polyprotein [Termitomyces sp. J132]|nr:Pro-Pol polyprotein [Termitomyces sp. J132]